MNRILLVSTAFAMALTTGHSIAASTNELDDACSSLAISYELLVSSMAQKAAPLRAISKAIASEMPGTISSKAAQDNLHGHVREIAAMADALNSVNASRQVLKCK